MTEIQINQLKELKSYFDTENRTAFQQELTPEQATVYTTVGGVPHLDGEYTVFGEVVNGLDVVEKIQNMPCDTNNRPLEDVRILKVEFIK